MARDTDTHGCIGSNCYSRNIFHDDLTSRKGEKTMNGKRGVSPGIVLLILLAISITITVAVSYWMGGISSQYTETVVLEKDEPITLHNTTITYRGFKRAGILGVDCIVILEVASDGSVKTREIKNPIGKKTLVDDLKLNITNFGKKRLRFFDVTPS